MQTIERFVKRLGMPAIEQTLYPDGQLGFPETVFYPAARVGKPQRGGNQTFGVR
jgi:hypothetical protein